MMTRRIALVVAAVSVLLGAIGAAAQKDGKDQASDWTGKLRLNVVAIGGETTGIVIETAKAKFEVQPATDAVRADLKKLDGQQVTVHGTLATRPGIEVKERRIITVTRVAKAKRSWAGSFISRRTTLETPS